MKNIAIIGLGLIGGSLGLALKNSNLAEAINIVGYDQKSETLSTAFRIKAIDAMANSPAEAASKADIIFIATPVLAIKQVLMEIASHLQHEAIITDVASTKVEIMSWARQKLPETSFIGGHPMAGGTGSIDEARPDLFCDAVYCLVPGKHTTSSAYDTLEEIVRAMGAHPRAIPAEQHDKLVAGISHLPFIASAALMKDLVSHAEWTEMAALAGSGFRDMTRLAGGDPVMHRDIVATNSHAITFWLDSYIEQLQKIRDMINSQDAEEKLLRFFQGAQSGRREWEKLKNANSG